MHCRMYMAPPIRDIVCLESVEYWRSRVSPLSRGPLGGVDSGGSAGVADGRTGGWCTGDGGASSSRGSGN